MTDLLGQLIRDQAPRPREEFAASLDRRVELGFAAPASSAMERDPIWPWEGPLARLVRGVRTRPMRAVAIAALVALVGGGVFTSTRPSAPTPKVNTRGAVLPSSTSSRGVDDFESVPMDGDYASDRYDATKEQLVKGEDGARSATTAVSGTVTDYRRYILGSGLFLTAAPKRIPDVVARAVEVADDLGGYPGSSSFDVNGKAATGSADIWIPTDRFAEAMSRLSKLGTVERTTQASRDITASRAGLVDEISRDRALLREIDQRGSSANDPQREAIQNQLELRQQRLANLDRRVEMTLINVKVRGVAPKPKVYERWSIPWALDTAGDIIGRIAALLVVAAAVLLLPAVIAGAAWAGWLARRRRQRRRTLDD